MGKSLCRRVLSFAGTAVCVFWRRAKSVLHTCQSPVSAVFRPIRGARVSHRGRHAVTIDPNTRRHHYGATFHSLHHRPYWRVTQYLRRNAPMVYRPLHFHRATAFTQARKLRNEPHKNLNGTPEESALVASPNNFSRGFMQNFSNRLSRSKQALADAAFGLRQGMCKYLSKYPGLSAPEIVKVRRRGRMVKSEKLKDLRPARSVCVFRVC